MNPYQNSSAIFHKNRGKKNPKIHMETQKPQRTKAILRKKNKA